MVSKKRSSHAAVDFAGGLPTPVKSLSDLQFQYYQTQNAAVLAVKMSKNHTWEEFGSRLDFNYILKKKYFG